MATMQMGGRTSRAAAQEADTGRRRAARQSAGWLLVEAVAGGGARKHTGRLLDTSSGGLGLVLDDEITPGTVVRVMPSTANAPSGSLDWVGRQARVAYAVPLPGGSWRIGLTFATSGQGGLQIWGTRLLLLSVFSIATLSAMYSDAAGSLAGVLLAAIAVTLAIGAEWQQRQEGRAAFYGPPKATVKR